jgi:hypothetical protein
MNIDELKAKYSAIAGKVITSRRDNFFRIESNKPVTFFVLLAEYSSRGVWIHPVATHFLGRRYSCSNVVEPNSCYVCEQLVALEEELTVMKQECEEKQKISPLEAQQLAVQIAEFEKRIQSARAQEKYAFNILVKGEEIPRIFEAPKSVAGPIVQVFETVLEEENINIFDPLAATAFTVTKEGENLLTRYKVLTAPRPIAILTGEDRDGRIERVIAAGFNLDERYKIPTRTELVTAWENYLNGTPDQPQQASSFTAAPATRAPVMPVSMSRIGGRPVVAATVTKPPPPPKSAPVPVAAPVAAPVETPTVEHPQNNGGNAPPEASSPNEPPHPKLPSHTPKPDSEAVKATLLHRLKAASVKK